MRPVASKSSRAKKTIELPEDKEEHLERCEQKVGQFEVGFASVRLESETLHLKV